jgi:SAM-dependent methyltransferase
MGEFNFGYFDYKKKHTKRKNIHNKSDVIKRCIANEFDFLFYDGPREVGYGGYKYDGRWKEFIPRIIKRYNLTNKSKVLEIGCRKGFFLNDIKEILPGIKIVGVEDHKYPLKKSLKSVKSKLKYIEKYYLIRYPKNYFDFVMCFNNIYRYNFTDMLKVFRVMEKVAKNKFITIPSFETEKEKIQFENFSYTGQTILTKKDWLKLFKYTGYTGDYFFTSSKVFGL